MPTCDTPKRGVIANDNVSVFLGQHIRRANLGALTALFAVILVDSDRAAYTMPTVRYDHLGTLCYALKTNLLVRGYHFLHYSELDRRLEERLG